MVSNEFGTRADAKFGGKYCPTKHDDEVSIGCKHLPPRADQKQVSNIEFIKYSGSLSGSVFFHFLAPVLFLWVSLFPDWSVAIISFSKRQFQSLVLAA